MLPTCYLLLATCYLLFAPCYMLRLLFRRLHSLGGRLGAVGRCARPQRGELYLLYDYAYTGHAYCPDAPSLSAVGYAYQVGSRLRGRVRTDSYSLIQQHVKRGTELTKLVQSGVSYASATDAMRRQAEARLQPLQHGHSAPTLPPRGNRDYEVAGAHESHGVEEQRTVRERDLLKATADMNSHASFCKKSWKMRLVENAAAMPTHCDPEPPDPEPKGGMGGRQSAWPTVRRSRASLVLTERAISNCRPQTSAAPTHASCGPAPTRFTPSRLQPPQPPQPPPLQLSASAPGLGIADVALRVMAEEGDSSSGERPNPVSRGGFAPIYYRRGAAAPLAVSQADLSRLIAQQSRAREGGPRHGGSNCTVESAEGDEVGRPPPSRKENERLSTPQAFRLKLRKCEYLHMQQLHHKKLESAISAFDEERPQTRAFRTAAVGTTLELPAAQQLAQHALPTMRLQASTIHAEYARLRTERDKRRGGVSFSRGRQRR